jgi:hypothetical protein
VAEILTRPKSPEIDLGLPKPKLPRFSFPTSTLPKGFAPHVATMRWSKSEKEPAARERLRQHIEHPQRVLRNFERQPGLR